MTRSLRQEDLFASLGEIDVRLARLEHVGGSNSMPVGSVLDWPWGASEIPVGYVLPYGQAVSRATFAALHLIAQSSGYPYGVGDGSTTFNLPDYRGRSGVGKDDMGGTAANRVTIAGAGLDGRILGLAGGQEAVVITSLQMPAHNHSATSPSHSHTTPLVVVYGGAPFGTPGGDAGQTGFAINDGNLMTWAEAGGNWPYHSNQTVNKTTTATSATINVNNTGSDQAHQNIPPTIIVNKIMRA